MEPFTGDAVLAVLATLLLAAAQAANPIGLTDDVQIAGGEGGFCTVYETLGGWGLFHGRGVLGLGPLVFLSDLVAIKLTREVVYGCFHPVRGAWC